MDYEHQPKDKSESRHDTVGRQPEIANLQKTRKHLAILDVRAAAWDAGRLIFAFRVALCSY